MIEELLLIDDFGFLNSDRVINIIKESDTEPLAVKNARLFMNEPLIISNVGSSISACLSCDQNTSISPLRVRSQLSPYIKMSRGQSKRLPNTLLV